MERKGKTVMAWDNAKRAKAAKVRKRNNLLRKKGLLPPVKKPKRNGGESISLDNPIFDKAKIDPETKKRALQKYLNKKKSSENIDKEIALRLLALLEHVLGK
jgi:hypothetical protein